MFLYDETRIINTASVERFGFTAGHNYPLSSPWAQPGYPEGLVIAEFEKDDGSHEILYEGNAEACQKFYLNLVKALAQGDRMVAIKDLQPEASD